MSFINSFANPTQSIIDYIYLKLPAPKYLWQKIISTLILFSLLITCAFADDLPDLGSPDRAVFSRSQESSIGKEYMQYLRASGGVVEDPIDRQYINDLGNQLVAASGQTDQHFYFFFMASPEINAFAGPDGYIAVFSGLMLATDDQEELASVMAHEIAHVLQGHISRKIADASKQKYQTLAGMLAAIALGTVSGQAAEAALLGTVAGNQQQQLNFSRQMEAEADRVGITILANAHYDPQSMPNFFQKLQRNERYYMKVPELLSNHPLTPNRISDAENRAAQYATRHHETPSTYYLVKERLRVIAAHNPHDVITYYQRSLKQKNIKNKFVKTYGYALALQNNQQYDKALLIMKGLMHDYPNQVIFQIGYADIAADAGKPEIGLPIIKEAHELYPDNYAITQEYAYVLYAAKNYNSALTLIRQYHLDYPDGPVPYALLSQIQGKAGKLAEAYQTRALMLVQYGAFKDALAQLQVALKLPDLTPENKSKIKAQIKNIKKKIKQQEK